MTANLKTLHSVARNPYAWPGGYQRLLVLSDGETVCPRCVDSEYPSLYRATRDGDLYSGWAIVGEYIHWEGEPVQCAHCYAEIPSEYGDPDYFEED